MQKLTNWIKHHQVAAFFILVYGIAWSGMILIYFVFPGNELVEVLCMPFVLFSPALSAMLISGIAEPRPKHKSSRLRWIAFILSWLISALIIGVIAALAPTYQISQLDPAQVFRG